MAYPLRYVPLIREPESGCNQATQWRPGDVVTLLEILESSAEAFWRVSGLLGQAIIKLEGFHEFGRDAAAVLGEILASIRGESIRLNLRSTLAQLDRIQTYVTPGGHVFLDELRAMLVELNNRICDDLDDRFFLSIPSENVSYYRPLKPLFGETVEAKFPEMSEDISEAAKCLALSRATAAIFHLMRVMEIAVQRFGDKFGVTFATEKNWQNILDEINKAIRALDQKNTRTRAYAEASAHLYNVKVCWRNAVMHPKQTYTPDEARTIFAAVKTFISDLADVL